MLSDKLEGTSLTTESAFMNLHEQHAVIYDDLLGEAREDLVRSVIGSFVCRRI
jgi:hypothetical protein